MAGHMERMLLTKETADKMMQKLREIHDDPENDVNEGTFGSRHNPADCIQRVKCCKFRENALGAFHMYSCYVVAVQAKLSQSIVLANPQAEDTGMLPTFDEQSADDCKHVFAAFTALAKDLCDGNYTGDAVKLKMPADWRHHLFGDTRKICATGTGAILIFLDAGLDFYYFQYAAIGATACSPGVVATTAVAPQATTHFLGQTSFVVKSAGTVVPMTNAGAVGTAKVAALVGLSCAVKVAIVVASGYLIYRYYRDGHHTVDLYVPTKTNIENVNEAEPQEPPPISEKEAIITLNLINALTLRHLPGQDTFQHYIMLGVQHLFPRASSDFTEQEMAMVKENYRMLSAKFHPDRNSSLTATEAQQMINNAYDFMFPVCRG